MKPGESLDIESQIFSDWIIGHYQEKNVRYVITYGNDYIIFSGRILISLIQIFLTLPLFPHQ